MLRNAHRRADVHPTGGHRGFRRPRARHAAAAGALAVLCSVPPLLAASSADGGETAEAQRLLTEHKCYICHSDHQAKAGPAYADVAAQFRGTRAAQALIAAEIRNGIRRGGPWHMPPHPEVSTSEARAMARYILSLDASAPPPR